MNVHMVLTDTMKMEYHMKSVPVTERTVHIALNMIIKQTPVTVNHKYSGKQNLSPEPNADGNNVCTLENTNTANTLIVGNMKDTDLTNIPNVKVVNENLE